MSRLKLVAGNILDAEADHVVELAKAGFQRKTIATEVYGADSRGNPSESSKVRVNTILRREEIGVTDYRKGNNSLGRAVIVNIRGGADLLAAVRASSKATLQKLKSA